MKVAIGCDHGGINLKPILVDYLQKNKIEYKDFGCYSAESVDYNDYALQVSNAVRFWNSYLWNGNWNEHSCK